MISRSPATYVFIRSFVLWFRSIAPICILYCFLRITLLPAANRLPLAFEIHAAAEAAFYLFVFLPRSRALQKPSLQPPPAPTRAKRHDLFQKCQSTVSDPLQYWSLWFRGSPFEEIGRENVKDWICWGFLNKDSWTADDEEELEGYVAESESMLGRKFEPGRKTAIAMRPTLDPVKILHRPLLFYVVSLQWSSCPTMLLYIFCTNADVSQVWRCG